MEMDYYMMILGNGIIHSLLEDKLVVDEVMDELGYQELFESI